MQVRHLVWIVLASLALFGSPAMAQSDNPIDSETPKTIGVFGDSLADGMWVGLRYHLSRDDRVGTIEQLSEVSTGLSNWVYKDVSDKTQDQLTQGRYDIAVVMFGANDMQGIRDNEGGIHSFRSESWEAIYRERIDLLINQFKDHGADVYWIGLPTMRSQRYDGNVQFLNTLFEERAEAAGITFVPTRRESAWEDGRYSAFLPDSEGVDRLARVGDGVHFTLYGYRRIAAPVVDAIEYGLDNPGYQTASADTDAEQALNVFEMTRDGELWICHRQPDAEAALDAVTIAPPR